MRIHVLSKAIEVLLLLGELLLELQELFLLALADGVVLGGLFAALEGVTAVFVWSSKRSDSRMVVSFGALEIREWLFFFSGIGNFTGSMKEELTLGRRSWGERRCRLRSWRGQWW